MSTVDVTPCKGAAASHFRCNLEQTVGNGCAIIQLTLEVHIMPLFQFAAVIIVVGVLLWIVNTYIPMARSMKSILNAVVVIVVVFWILNVFGILDSVRTLRIGRS